MPTTVDLGYLDDWTPARAARAQEATERYLLGSCRPAQVETAAERVRRRLTEDARAGLLRWRDVSTICD
jgi:hypothetical protein